MNREPNEWKEYFHIARYKGQWHTQNAGVIADDEESERVRQYHVQMMYFFDGALDAISKQIPKKPIKQKWDYSNMFHYACPTCKECLEWDPYELFEPKYCPDCGQAIDWSDDNETV